MAIQKKATSNVRIGIVSFITLISVLLLAVLSVLCVSTARATSATTERQATSVSELYEVDAVGQAILATVDGKLAGFAKNGESATFAASHLNAQIADIATDAFELAGVDDGVQVSSDYDGKTFSFTVSSDDDRTLEAQIELDSDLSYTITSWKTSTTQTVSETSLWGGSTAN